MSSSRSFGKRLENLQNEHRIAEGEKAQALFYGEAVDIHYALGRPLAFEKRIDEAHEAGLRDVEVGDERINHFESIGRINE